MLCLIFPDDTVRWCLPMETDVIAATAAPIVEAVSADYYISLGYYHTKA